MYFAVVTFLPQRGSQKNQIWSRHTLSFFMPLCHFHLNTHTHTHTMAHSCSHLGYALTQSLDSLHPSKSQIPARTRGHRPNSKPRWGIKGRRPEPLPAWPIKAAVISWERSYEICESYTLYDSVFLFFCFFFFSLGHQRHTGTRTT